MANKKVTLVRYCKTPTGWKRYPIVMGKNGQIRPEYALVHGIPTHLPEGCYQIRGYNGTRTIYTNVGTDAANALAALRRMTHIVIARESAALAGVKLEVESSDRLSTFKTGRPTLQDKKKEYIERQIIKGHHESAATVTVAIDNFLAATKCMYADQINEKSILTFYKHLRDIGNGDRTIHGKHVSLFAWLKWMKLDIKSLAERPPKFTKREVSVYHAADLKKFFRECNDYLTVVFETLLKTGMRYQEAMFLEWSNVDFRAKMIRVRERLADDDNGVVRIKDRAERSVPLPDDLAATLMAWRRSHPKCRLVLGTKYDTPNRKWLPALKRLVRRAGLNCGQCHSCRSKNECSLWKIHKFRGTYITTLHRNGVDARTIMKYTGHEDLETILLYLAAAEDAPMQKKINTIKWM